MAKKRKIKYKNLSIMIILLMIIIILITILLNKSKYQITSHNNIDNIPLHHYDIELLQNDNGLLSYPNATLGIDVSSHQGNIDFEKVKNDGIDFVFIRIGYRGYQSGNISLDEKFEENIINAKKAGLKVGVYFFSQAINEKEAIDEANFVLKHLKKYQLDLPIAYDLEKIDYDDNYRTKDLTAIEKSNIALAFCGRIEHQDQNVIIYTNPDLAYNHYDINALYNYDIWLANYIPQFNYPYDFKYWQFSEHGKVYGIDIDVDLNLMFN